MTFINPKLLSPSEYERYAFIENWPSPVSTSNADAEDQFKKNLESAQAEFSRKSDAELLKLAKMIGSAAPVLQKATEIQTSAKEAVQARDMFSKWLLLRFNTLRTALASLPTQAAWIKEQASLMSDPLIQEKWADFLIAIFPEANKTLREANFELLGNVSFQDMGIPDETWKTLIKMEPELALARPELVEVPSLVTKVPAIAPQPSAAEGAPAAAVPLPPPLQTLPTPEVVPHLPTPAAAPPLPTPVPIRASEPPLSTGASS